MFLIRNFLLVACEEPSDEDRANDLGKKQLVMELDMATWKVSSFHITAVLLGLTRDFWKRAIEVFHITEPVIPQRPKAQTRIGNKWYG